MMFKVFILSFLIPMILYADSCQAKEKIVTKFIKTRSGEVSYHIQNPDAKKTLFLIHGFGDAFSSFQPIFSFGQEAGYRIVYYDLPGMGENKHIAITFEEQITLFSSIAQREKTPNSTILAHSMGGLIGLLSAVRSNIQYARLLTIEPSITSADYAFFTFIQEPPIGIGLDSLIETHQPEGGYDATYHQNLRRSDITTLKEHAKTIFEHFNTYRAEILNAKLPFLYFYGEQSSEIDQRKKMSEFPQVQVYAIHKAQHWSHLDNTPQFLSIIQTVLKDKK